MSTPDWLEASGQVALIQSLHTLAWADGRMRPSERDALVRTIRALGVTASRGQIVQWLLQRPSEDEATVESLPAGDRRAFLSAAIRLSCEDGHYDDEERARIRGWASGWEMSDLQLQAIEREVREEMRQDNG
jgi:tellurite resistance protein